VVSHRAVLVGSMSILSNLALPLTVSVEPVAADVRTRVEAVARDVGLAMERLESPASTLSAVERLRVHLARALMQEPDLILLEHPTSGLPDAPDRASYGHALRSAADAGRAGWVAISDDAVFAKAAGGIHLRVRRETGDVHAQRSWAIWR
jgi:ABC-type lipoprotein export system ATPase subunit